MKIASPRAFYWNRDNFLALLIYLNIIRSSPPRPQVTDVRRCGPAIGEDLELDALSCALCFRVFVVNVIASEKTNDTRPNLSSGMEALRQPSFPSSTITQLTNYKAHSHHLYFTNPGWYADRSNC